MARPEVSQGQKKGPPLWTVCGHVQQWSLGTGWPRRLSELELELKEHQAMGGVSSPSSSLHYGDNPPPCSGPQGLPLQSVGFSLGKSSSNPKVVSKPNKK